MSPVRLLDVNVLIALFNEGHSNHELAHDWFADNRADGWATCPLTENGLLRVLGNPSNRSEFLSLPELGKRLRKFCASGGHEFWPDEISLRDEHQFNLSLVHGYRQLTDMYLLGIAVTRNGRLATFDHRISLAAVKGARREHLEVIAPAEPS